MRMIICRCGAKITKNTYKQHVKSERCFLDRAQKKYVLCVLELKSRHRWAWSKEFGENAVYDVEWYISVIDGKSSLDDWTFTPPRKRGVCRSEMYEKYKKERTGTANPACKCKKFGFSKEEVVEFTKNTFNECVRNEEMNFGDIHKIVNGKYPNYRYLFGQKLKHRKFLSMCTGVEESTLKDVFAKRRGLFISIGQRNSPDFIKKSSELASKLISEWRISKPHKVLYELVKSVDNNAVIEYKLTAPGGRLKSFDIYSPLINCLIEMHGRFWHDDTHKPDSALINLIKQNMQNDQLKKDIAKTSNMNYTVFWDDQMDSWCCQIERLYNQRVTVDYEEIKNKVYQKSGN